MLPLFAHAMIQSRGTMLVAAAPSGSRASAAIAISGSPVARASAIASADTPRRVSDLGFPPSPPYAYCTILDPHRTVPSDAMTQSFMRCAIRRCLYPLSETSNLPITRPTRAESAFITFSIGRIPSTRLLTARPFASAESSCGRSRGRLRPHATTRGGFPSTVWCPRPPYI